MVSVEKRLLGYVNLQLARQNFLFLSSASVSVNCFSQFSVLFKFHTWCCKGLVSRAFVFGLH